MSQFTPIEDASSFRRMAAAMWRSPSDPSIYGSMDVDATHWFLKAVRIAGGSAIDGSYGLGLSPDRRYLLSAHRGLNEVIVYRYPELEVHRRIAFPPMSAFYKHLGRLSDPRLGVHHATIKELS